MMANMKFPFKKNKHAAIDDFWEWFQSPDGRKALSELWTESQTSGEAANRIGRRLKKVAPGLSWGAQGGEPSRFEVSASGIAKFAPIVREVVERAPAMNGWEVVAFKQPVENEELVFQGRSVSYDSTMCQILGSNGPKVEVNVFLPLPAGTPQAVVNEIGFIMLDHSLGEELVMTRVGGIQFDTTLVAPPTVMPMREFAAKMRGNN